MKLQILFLTLLTIICPALSMEDENNNNNNSITERRKKIEDDRRLREKQDHEFAKSLAKDQEKARLSKKECAQEDNVVDFDEVRRTRMARFAPGNSNSLPAEQQYDDSQEQEIECLTGALGKLEIDDVPAAEDSNQKPAGGAWRKRAA